MLGLKLFWELIKSASAEILENKKTYGRAFIALVVLGNLETLFPFLGVAPESNISIFLTVIVSLATFTVLCQIVLTQKKNRGGRGELKYLMPTFLLYHLYYSFLFFGGLLLLVLPGLYAMVFFAMMPFVAVLDDQFQGSYLKESKLLVKRNISLVAWATGTNLVAECLVLLISPIQNPAIKGIVNLVLSLPDAFITMVMTVTLVKIYYHLRDSNLDYDSTATK